MFHERRTVVNQDMVKLQRPLGATQGILASPVYVLRHAY
jgi:hypothetical protein